MSIAFRCQCGARFNLPDSKAGLKSKCPKCGCKLVVPAASTVSDDELAQWLHRASPLDEVRARRAAESVLRPESPPRVIRIGFNQPEHKSAEPQAPVQETAQRVLGTSYPVAPIQSTDGGWVLNPDTTFPLTFFGVDYPVAMQLKDLLDQTATIHATGLFPSVAALVAQTGLRCKEIEDYVTQFRETIEADKEPDIVPYCDLYSLLDGQRVESVVGGNLVAKYGFENLRFYARHPKMIGAPRPIPPTHRDRKRFEELVRVGLATMGPPMSKAGKSGEAFSLNMLEGSIDLDDLSLWIGYCLAVAELVTLTYSSSVGQTRSAQFLDRPEIFDDIWGYKVITAGDDRTCRFCARMDGKKYPAGSRPKLPFHVGCRCGVLEIFRDEKDRD